MTVMLWVFGISLLALAAWIAVVELGRRYWGRLEQRSTESQAQQLKDEAGKPPDEGQSNVS